MNTTSPLFVLKRQAKALSQKAQIPYLTALDRVAQTQGFERWTLLLKSRIEDKNSASHVLTQLVPGDLLLLAARPGQGKTLFGLELLCLAIKQGRRGWFFTLEHNLSDVLDRLHDLGQKPSHLSDRFEFDNTDSISADYLAERLRDEPAGTLVVVDYLQLLDQKRVNAELQPQVQLLRAMAKHKGLIIVMISQIDRSFDARSNKLPDLTNVRLPNPLDLSLFSKYCFLNNGTAQCTANHEGIDHPNRSINESIAT